MQETNCPRCNPEGKSNIRRLNKTSVCLICMNTGWTVYDKKCKDCGEDSGVYNFCDKCSSECESGVRIEKKWLPITIQEIST